MSATEDKVWAFCGLVKLLFALQSPVYVHLPLRRRQREIDSDELLIDRV